MTAYSASKQLREFGICIALGAQRKEVLQGGFGASNEIADVWFGGRLILGLLATRVLAYIVYEATPRDPLVLAQRCAGYCVAGAAGYMGSCTTRAVGESLGAALG